MEFLEIKNLDYIFLYAGDILDIEEYNIKGLFGLSINRSDKRHIKHDITVAYPLMDNCVDCYQAEDVFEHIEYDKLIGVINEIYRILKPGGAF